MLYNVYLNGQPDPISVEAENPEAACKQAKDQLQSNRDIRNFRAISKDEDGKAPAIPEAGRKRKG